MKSFKAVFLGMVLAFVLGLLLMAGVFGPFYSTFFGEAIGRQLAFPTGIFIFAFSFYFGGMIASYRAPSRRLLHGLLVSIASFVVSLVVNLGFFAAIDPSEDPLGGLRTPGTLLFTISMLLVSILASYLGAWRGISLIRYNEQFAPHESRPPKRPTSRRRSEGSGSEGSTGKNSES